MGFFSRRRRQARGNRIDEAKEEFARAQREFAAEHFDAAASMFRTVVALTPDSPNSQFMLGVSLFMAGDLKAALEPLRRCIALRPEHDDAHFILGVALGRMDQFKQGEAHLARAAWLGNEQARERLPEVGADYCHRCARAVQIASDSGEKAAVRFLTLDVGLCCADCHIVLCTACAGLALGLQERPPCPDCGGRLLLRAR